jgi:hypothetical protein
MNFKSWFAEVDSVFSAKTGFSVLDLEDFRWKDCYAAELSATEAIEEFVRCSSMAKRLWR